MNFVFCHPPVRVVHGRVSHHNRNAAELEEGSLIANAAMKKIYHPLRLRHKGTEKTHRQTQGKREDVNAAFISFPLSGT